MCMLNYICKCILCGCELEAESPGDVPNMKKPFTEGDSG